MKWKRATFDKVTGSYLLGYIDVSYQKLCAVFGPPNLKGSADGKVMAEWAIEFEDGEVATIYDFKTCHTYCGNGLMPEQNTDWNIGGFNTVCVHRIHKLIAAVTNQIHKSWIHKSWIQK